MMISKNWGLMIIGTKRYHIRLDTQRNAWNIGRKSGRKGNGMIICRNKVVGLIEKRWLGYGEMQISQEKYIL